MEVAEEGAGRTRLRDSRGPGHPTPRVPSSGARKGHPAGSQESTMGVSKRGVSQLSPHRGGDTEACVSGSGSSCC